MLTVVSMTTANVPVIREERLRVITRQCHHYLRDDAFGR